MIVTFDQDEALGIVLGSVAMWVRGDELLMLDHTRSALDVEIVTFQVIRRLTHLLAQHLPAGIRPEVDGHLEELTFELIELERQADPTPVRIRTAHLVHQQDLPLLHNLIQFMVIGLATLVREGHLAWPYVTYGRPELS